MKKKINYEINSRKKQKKTLVTIFVFLSIYVLHHPSPLLKKSWTLGKLSFVSAFNLSKLNISVETQ